ncbi:aminotransferase class IV [Paramaledivibacter caminithermalis]|uniref:Branched-chain amino acid aminotransferase n=1 Tax=Paramaledivibacter caminithermalis (strain DSM 15212 / CIP 107654 / DViRD3) TaxID=1121301 RepID=A0A1M6LFH3_PARC5|nr:aminotransferase class IV [Paramaledivibacter caminithermalis]SHJ69959.1 branched-chain amino acid aminotransferase [Paramaledivibacter caminithermalis DSM 15212]
MVKESILDYVIYNSKIYSSAEINISKSEKKSIYEVIRIIEGIPLYLEEHITRLRKSAQILNENIDKSDKELTYEIIKLIEINKEYNGNIKILCIGDEEGFGNIYLYFIRSFYPSKEMYEEGIHTILYQSERKNPNVKTFNQHLRQMINIELKEQNAFEALLVNDNNQITEGSRSNVFFVKDEKLFTSPANDVLLGVTRSKIMELCKMQDIGVVQRKIAVDSLKEYDAAFITGTSINVLPIKSIGNISFNSSKNDIIIKVMGIYERDKTDYIKKRKNI